MENFHNLLADKKDYQDRQVQNFSKPSFSQKTVNLLSKTLFVVYIFTTGLIGGYLIRGCDEPVPCRIGDRKTYPPLSNEERKVFENFHQRPFLVQKWINDNVKYKNEWEQFGGSLCDDKEHCNIWAPGVYFLRSKQEDCDGPILFVHHALNYLGHGLGLKGREKDKEGKIKLDENGNEVTFAHVVYVYPENNFYGAISINKFEFREPNYETIDDLARSLNPKNRYESYRILYLPNDPETVLYDFDAMKKATRGEEINF